MKYIAVIDPPTPPPTKEFVEAVKKHKKFPKKHPMPEPPEPGERIVVGAFNTPYLAAAARNNALRELKFWNAFYHKPKDEPSPPVNRVTTPKTAFPRDRKKMITLGQLKKNEQRKNKANNQKNAEQRTKKRKSTT